VSCWPTTTLSGDGATAIALQGGHQADVTLMNLHMPADIEQ
jgi:hypothetical protein